MAQGGGIAAERLAKLLLRHEFLPLSLQKQLLLKEFKHLQGPGVLHGSSLKSRTSTATTSRSQAIPPGSAAA